MLWWIWADLQKGLLPLTLLILSYNATGIQCLLTALHQCAPAGDSGIIPHPKLLLHVLRGQTHRVHLVVGPDIERFFHLKECDIGVGGGRNIVGMDIDFGGSSHLRCGGLIGQAR